AKNLERAGYEVEHAPHGEAALARLESVTFDVVLTDLKMPVVDGMDLLRAMHERHIGDAAVVLTGYGTIEAAAEAMNRGAADYLIKDARPQEILLTLERVLRLTSLQSENARLRREIGRLHGFGELIGQSPSMEAVYRLIDAVSHNKSTVLLSGESGTGKELVARTVHQRGILRDAPFVAINCAGLSETLLDSQLFGHRRGAFTGAVADHDGVFRAATSGTLLLDEVAEIPLGLQAKFLRAIQEREVTPLGSTRPVPVDVRLIAATNRDLEAEARVSRLLFPPLARRPHRAAAAAPPPRGHPAARGALPHSLLGAIRGGREEHRTGRAGRPRRLLVAREHPAAPECHRARIRAVGRRRDRPPRPSPGGAGRRRGRAVAGRDGRHPDPGRCGARADRRRAAQGGRQQERSVAAARHRSPAPVPEDREVRPLTAAGV